MATAAPFRSLASAALLVAAFAALAALAAEEVPPPPPLPAGTAPPPAAAPIAKRQCLDCAVIRSIRIVERDRPARRDVPSYIASEQYLDTRRYSAPYVGPMLGMTFGPGQEAKPYVGAVGSEAMRQRIVETVYEIVVRYDDGRDGLIEQDDASAFRVGDRVRVVDNQVELAPRGQ